MKPHCNARFLCRSRMGALTLKACPVSESEPGLVLTSPAGISESFLRGISNSRAYNGLHVRMCPDRPLSLISTHLCRVSTWKALFVTQHVPASLYTGTDHYARLNEINKRGIQTHLQLTVFLCGEATRNLPFNNRLLPCTGPPRGFCGLFSTCLRWLHCKLAFQKSSSPSGNDLQQEILFFPFSSSMIFQFYLR